MRSQSWFRFLWQAPTKKVRNETLYHINSAANFSQFPLMAPGQIIQVGNHTNPFYAYYEQRQRTYPVTEASGVVTQVPAMRFLRRVRERTINPANLAGDAFEIATHFQMLARELLWEGVRLQRYRNAPSRLRCMWLIESIADAQRWLALMHFRPAQIVKVKATGRVLTVDQSQLAGDSEPLPIWVEKANLYWSGIQTASPLREVLFEGTVRVERIAQAVP